MKVLIIEDARATAAITANLLRHAGHDAEMIATAAEARQRLRGSAPDVVLLDWLLGDELSGHLLLEICGTWPAARVLISTAFSIAELPPIPSSVHLLLKPYSADVLLSAVESTGRTYP